MMEINTQFWGRFFRGWHWIGAPVLAAIVGGVVFLLLHIEGQVAPNVMRGEALGTAVATALTWPLGRWWALRFEEHSARQGFREQLQLVAGKPFPECVLSICWYLLCVGAIVGLAVFVAIDEIHEGSSVMQGVVCGLQPLFVALAAWLPGKIGPM